MISLDKVNATILELESARDTTFAACSKLADLYVVRNNLTNAEPKLTAQPLTVDGDSKFMQTAAGKNSVEVWQVIDELMDVIHITAPKLYDSVLNRIDQIN